MSQCFNKQPIRHAKKSATENHILTEKEIPPLFAYSTKMFVYEHYFNANATYESPDFLCSLPPPHAITTYSLPPIA